MDIATQIGKKKTTISQVLNGDPRTAVATSHQVTDIINNALNDKLTGRRQAVNE